MINITKMNLIDIFQILKFFMIYHKIDKSYCEKHIYLIREVFSFKLKILLLLVSI